MAEARKPIDHSKNYQCDLTSWHLNNQDLTVLTHINNILVLAFKG